MSAFVDDFGSAHPQTKQARVSIQGLSFLPLLILTPVETSDVSEITDTYDTKDGEAHSAGPNAASQEFTLSLYESAIAEVQAMETWLKQRGSTLAKVNVLVEYPYSDGTKGTAFRLHRAWCTQRRTGGTGSAGAATTTFTIRYKRATRV